MVNFYSDNPDVIKQPAVDGCCYNKSIKNMIIPDNNLPPDDTDNSASDDQQSQKDIHSNGFDGTAPGTRTDDASDADRLQQASDASTPSFTLNTDDEPGKKEDRNT